jgi:hypothetical protein
MILVRSNLVYEPLMYTITNSHGMYLHVLKHTI